MNTDGDEHLRGARTPGPRQCGDTGGFLRFPTLSPPSPGPSSERTALAQWGRPAGYQGGLGSLWSLAVEDSEEVPLVLQKSHPLVTPGPLVGTGCVSGPGRTYRTVGKMGRTTQPLVQEPSWSRRKVGSQVSWYPAGPLTTHALQSRG